MVSMCSQSTMVMRFGYEHTENRAVQKNIDGGIESIIGYFKKIKKRTLNF